MYNVKKFIFIYLTGAVKKIWIKEWHDQISALKRYLWKIINRKNRDKETSKQACWEVRRKLWGLNMNSSDGDKKGGMCLKETEELGLRRSGY